MSDKTITKVFTKLRKKLLNTAMAILPNEDDAADALQDAFCKLWPKRDTMDDEAKAEALTAVTLKNICIDKKRKCKIPTIPLDEEHDIHNNENTYNELEERFNKVKTIIDEKLTAIQKEVIELKEIEGLSIEEIARRTYSTEGAIKMQLSRARKKIRECYRKEVTDE